MVVLVGALVMLAATDEAQARRFRRLRGSCPNGQCPVAAPAKTAATSDAADAAVAEVPADATASSAAPRTALRRIRGIRVFRRR